MNMRYAALAVLLLVVLSVLPALADTSTTKTANVTANIAMYVALDNLANQHLTVAQDDAPQFGSIGMDQEIHLHKNVDVNLILDVTDMIPNAGTEAKGAQPLPVGHVSIEGRGGSIFPGGGHAEMVQPWVWCTENGAGEVIDIDYHWNRNGLCDHAGTYSAKVTVTAIGIDP